MHMTVTVTVDRPLGSHHPKYPDMVYPINYGYVAGLMAGDGMEQDAYILGVDAPCTCFTGKRIAVIRRENDCEDKWVVCPFECSFTAEEIRAMTEFQEKYFRSEILLDE